jgi:hypothetical protein
MTRKPKHDLIALPGPSPTELRYLTPDMCRVHLGSLGALHVTVLNERIYGGVYAAYAFPVAHPGEFISLIQTGSDRTEVEVGVIRRLSDFPEDQAQLIRKALQRRYFLHTIHRINQIGWKHGMLRLDVETDKGGIEFLMHWKQDRAVDYGGRGKVLIDVSENQYVIPDMQKLTARERQDFTRYIYW